MIGKIILFSVQNKLITGIFILLFVGFGIYSVTQLAVDALPDVTNNQVQVITNAPSLATQEVEQFITYPIEMQMKSIPDVVELRSTSRSGLSVVTIVFKDKVPLNISRQLVSEKLKAAEEQIPASYGIPDLVPPTTGLGEIYQYTIAVKPGFENKYTPMDLRTIQDWIVKRQLLGTQGIVDVSSFGGYLKQYEVAVAPEKLVSMGISLTEVFTALERNNQNTGGSYIEKGANIYFIRGEGLVKNLEDIESIVVKTVKGIPVKVRDLATVQFGYAARYGAMTRNGKGEAVGGVVLMLKGENSVRVIKAVKEQMAKIEKSLPEGLSIDVFVDRTKLIDKTVSTVAKNLIEGALIVVFVLVLLLGNLRAGLIVASVIPLAMLFAIVLMNLFGLSANLMSMGALDFGLIVDGAVIVIESILHTFSDKYKNHTLTQGEMDSEVIGNSSKIMSSAVFGQFIILIVYVPIFALRGIEGKMFLPMAQTVSFAIIGALILSLTYVPLMSSLFLGKTISAKETLSQRVIAWLEKHYRPLLSRLLNHRVKVVAVTVALFVGAILLFSRLGGEFIPEMDEGDFATNFVIRQGSNLQQSVKTSTQLENILLKNFPEVKEVVSKIGTSEVPTDPMPIETADLIIVLKDKKDWTSAKEKEELAEKMNEKMSAIPGVTLSFEQPIQMRFNELIAGIKSDVAIKIYGEDLDLLFEKGNEVSKLIAGIDGLADVKVEQVVGMPQLVVKYNRARIAQYGLNIEDVNKVLNSALAGGKAGSVYEGEKKFDLVVRLKNYRDADEDKVRNIYVPLADGSQIPISQIADVSFQSAPSQISRDNAERRIVVEANVRGKDIQTVVTDIQKKLETSLKLPPGYYIKYGGTFQNLQEAKDRLIVAVPVALLLIFLLLFLSFRSAKEALIIFSAIPLAAIGGVIALWARDMNFSISAGIGFIALFGVAVLNGIVLISYFNRLKNEGEDDVQLRILKGATARLRPVLATAAVASLGFLPMALSTSTGSEIQKPLATVVIGGLISSTLLTLLVLPILYSLMMSRSKPKPLSALALLLPLLLLSFCSNAQTGNVSKVTLDSCIAIALNNHPTVQGRQYEVDQQVQLKKTNFTLDPVTVTYQGGQISSGLYDNYVSVTTGIPFPTVTVRQTQYQAERINLAKSQLAVTKAELVREVSNAYVQLQYSLARLRLVNKLDSIYTNFATYAERKFKLGETGQLESISAQAQVKQLHLQKLQAAADVTIAKSVLAKWMNRTGDINVVEESEFTLPPPSLFDTSKLNGNPLMAYQQQQVTLSTAAYKLERAKFSPSLQFGYFNQSIDRVTGFNGFSIGASIPLLKTGQSGRSKAAKFGIKIAEKELENFKLSLDAHYIEALQQYEKYRASLQFYQTDGIALGKRLLDIADKSYRSGDIGYVEYTQTLTRASELQSTYLSVLSDYNRSVVQLNYLLNH